MQASVLVCECAHKGVVERPKLEAILKRLEAARIPVRVVPDLCGLAALRDPSLREFAAGTGLRILACYPRAVKALFGFAGAPLDAGTEMVNLREVSAEIALGRLGLAPAPSTEISTEVRPESKPEPNGWIPWFPVIDADRCTNCQQCLGFCLFGVYALGPDGRVAVQNPQACKTNCPACARICPHVAIIFPKYDSGAIAGAEITDEEKEKGRVQADLEKILGSDVYRALAERRERVRQRALLRPDLELARKERQQHLAGPDSSPPRTENAGSTASPSRP